VKEAVEEAALEPLGEVACRPLAEGPREGALTHGPQRGEAERNDPQRLEVVPGRRRPLREDVCKELQPSHAVRKKVVCGGAPAEHAHTSGDTLTGFGCGALDGFSARGEIAVTSARDSTSPRTTGTSSSRIARKRRSSVASTSAAHMPK
jgi:hypothetical protein